MYGQKYAAGGDDFDNFVKASLPTPLGIVGHQTRGTDFACDSLEPDRRRSNEAR